MQIKVDYKRIEETLVKFDEKKALFNEKMELLNKELDKIAEFDQSKVINQLIDYSKNKVNYIEKVNSILEYYSHYIKESAINHHSINDNCKSSLQNILSEVYNDKV